MWAATSMTNVEMSLSEPSRVHPDAPLNVTECYSLHRDALLPFKSEARNPKQIINPKLKCHKRRSFKSF